MEESVAFKYIVTSLFFAPAAPFVLPFVKVCVYLSVPAAVTVLVVVVVAAAASYFFSPHQYPLSVPYRLARERNFSPVLLARLVIEEHLRAKRGEGGGGGADGKVPKADVKALLSDPRRISDPRLGLEVKAAAWRDDVYGPLAEAVKASVGVEHEERLKRELR